MADTTSGLFNEIKSALEDVIYGSVEIYVQDKKITQITVRNIKKISVAIEEKPIDPAEIGEKKDRPQLLKKPKSPLDGNL